MQAIGTNSNVYLTALPNGSVKGKLQITLLFTLSLEGDNYATSSFTAWNSQMASYIVQRGNHWNVILSNSSTGAKRSAIVTNIADTGYEGGLDKDMWRAIFACVDPTSSTRQSRAKPNLRKARLKTHDGAYMIAALNDHRLKQFQARFLRDYPKRKSVQPADASQFALSADALQAEVDQQAQSVDVYLRPTYADAAPAGNNQTMAQLLAAIIQAKSLWSAASLGLLQAPFDVVDAYEGDALTYLEETERLREVGYLGLYKHCLTACRLGIEALTQGATQTGLLAVDAMAKTMGLDLMAVTQAMKIIDFMMLTRPSKKMVDCPPKPKPNPSPDFHQALSLVNRYTAMLRPLGLAIDLQCDVPSDIASFDTIEIQMPTVPPAPAAGHSSFNSVPMKTRYMFTAAPAYGGRAENFYAASQWETLDPKAQVTATDDKLLSKQRLLWLGATSNDPARPGDPLFVTVAQDVDGSLQKMYTSTSADARATEYRGNAVASDSSPSQRSTGISILHRGRGDRLQAALSKLIDPAVPLFAEEVTIGYRVDVRKGDLPSPQAADWFPLCSRKSVYSVYGNGTKQWKPRSDYEVAADEGFVTLGSLTTSDDGGETISFSQQIHSWNGWSSSVPAFFDPITGEKPNRTVDPSLRVLPIDAEYDLPDGRKLLPLRFDRKYAFRCRAVDLAGNSIACPPKKTDSGASLPDNTLAELILSHQMVREEPTRSPQILLDAPIDRKRKPGDHVDTLILRGTGDSLERVLVAPRETLRMAELQGNLTSRDLPPGAFPRVFLNPDATFPTVSDAYERGWFDRDGDALGVEEQDPIFHIGDLEPTECSYFPDPLARYICAQFATIPAANDAATSKPQYLNLYPSNGQGWPHTTPARIRLQAGDAVAIELKQMRLNRDGPGTETVDGLEITLPRAYRGTLAVSSAWCTQDQTFDNTPLVGLYHLNSGAAGARLPRAVGVTPKAGTQIPTATLVSSIYQRISATSAHQPLAVQALGSVKPEDLINGLVQAQTPAHLINLVHAVKQPLMAPGFPAGFDMLRTLGQPAAMMTTAAQAPWIADWNSTSKITCRATWTDCVDDLHSPCPVSTPHHEVVFEVTDPAKCGSSDPTKCIADQVKKHLFRDTRAHTVTYSLTATSAFRDCYPPDSDTSFEHPEHPTHNVPVASSARPAPPDIAYIIPAFRWVESYDEVKITYPVTQHQRTESIYSRLRLTYLRIYHNRPFFGSGDEERLCAILKQKASKSAATLKCVSQMGLDPTGIPTTTGGPILPFAELTAEMFENAEAPVTCYLAELPVTMSAVDVIPFPVEFAKERGLWFTDILLRPISQGADKVSRIAHAPLVRLAMARYQPHALCDATTGTDAHLSPLVFADFMQLASNRWCSVVRNGKSFTLAVSGTANERATTDPKPLPPPGVWRSADLTLNSLLTIELQHRWHDVEEEIG